MRVTTQAEAFWPLIEEARERQRRRRLGVVRFALLAALLAMCVAATGRGGGGSDRLRSSAATDSPVSTVQADVRSVIADFGNALVAGDYARACGLLDPWMGMATVRSATDEVGAKGGCEARLATFARVVGPRLVRELRNSPVLSVQYGGSESRGFSAAASIGLRDSLVKMDFWTQIVGVAKASPRAPVLITCPPVLCAWHFLAEYSALRVRTPLGRS